MCPFSVEESHVCTGTHKGPGAFPKKLPAPEYTQLQREVGPWLWIPLKPGNWQANPDSPT